jgi:hypothetical protein
MRLLGTGMFNERPNRLFDTDAQVRPRHWRFCSLRAGYLRRYAVHGRRVPYSR